MAGSGVDIGTGGSITFGTSGFAPEVNNITWGGISREVIETSHLGTSPAGDNEIGSKTYLAGKLSDPGEISIEGNFDVREHPPIEEDPETITVKCPLYSGDSTQGQFAADGQMTEFELTIPTEDKMGFTATIKITGPITITDPT